MLALAMFLLMLYDDNLFCYEYLQINSHQLFSSFKVSVFLWLGKCLHVDCGVGCIVSTFVGICASTS